MTHHGACLRSELEATGLSETDASRVHAAMMAGEPTPLLATADTALVEFVRQLTRSPATMSESDVAELRAQGLTDQAIYDATSIAGFFAYVNRLALGLGVPLESNWRTMLRP